MPRAVAVLVATLVGSAASSPAVDFDQIKARGVLHVIIANWSLPELYSDKPGAAGGLEREILEGFARLHRLRIEVVQAPDLFERFPVLLNGEADIAAGGVVNTEHRRQYANFTSELFPIRHIAVTAKPAPMILSVEQLRAARVGTVKGTSWAEEIARAGVPSANVVDSFPSTDELVAGLRAGTVSAIVLSAVWAIREQHKNPELQLGMFVGPATSVGFAVRRDAPQLLSVLDAYVSNVRRTATWSRLVVKYFGEDGLAILRKSRNQP